MRVGWVALMVACAAAESGAGSLVRNGGFDGDVAGWSAWYSPGEAEGAAKWVPRDGGGAMQIVVKRREKPTAVQIYQGPFAVEQGAWYAVSFEARAERAATMRLAMIRHSAPYGGLGLGTEVAVGEAWGRVDLLVQASRTSDNARIDFFPPVTMWLDNVSIRELGELPPAVKVEAVKPGPDWRGDPATLLDGKPQTSLDSSYYPDLPLLLTLDLGAARPVGAAIVDGIEYGRHNSVGQMAVEVSRDGQEWRRWASASRTSEGGVAGRRTTRFVASNIAVPVRYLRLRITRLRGGARLAEARVLAAESADPAALARLPRVPPEEDLVFLGWDYAKVGYALSPGEPLTLRFRNQSQQLVEASMKWRLEDYRGRLVASGSSVLRVDALGSGEIVLRLPDRVPTPPLRLRFDAGGREQAFCFDYRPPLSHRVYQARVAALLDCLDPEGWVKLITGPAGGYLDVHSYLFDDLQEVDVALVMAENWAKDDDRVQAIRRYLDSGGRVLLFGKVAPALDGLAPVRMAGPEPWLPRPQHLSRPPFWPDYEPAKAFPQIGVAVEAKPEAKVLSRWEDGTPAIVEGRVGKGRVLYLGVPPGRCWRLRDHFEQADELTVHALYYLMERSAAKAIADSVKYKEWFLQRSPIPHPSLRSGVHSTTWAGMSEGNVGRFGWDVGEGGLVENLAPDGSMRCPADPTPWRLVVPGHEPMRAVSWGTPSWLHKTLAFFHGRERVLEATVSAASPFIVWRNAPPRFAVDAEFTHVAFPVGKGVRVLAAGQQASGDGLADARWLVLLRARESVRDVPRILVVTNRLDRLSLGQRLELSFGKYGCSGLCTGRLYGLRRFAPGETQAWVTSFPAEAADQAAMLSRMAAAPQRGAGETFRLDGEAVKVWNGGSFKFLTNAWKIRPEDQKVVALPPVLSLLRRHGYPVEIEGKVRDTRIATKYGPLEVVEGGSVAYRLPLPPLDHFGLIPVEGKMELGEAIDKYGMQGIGTVRRSSGGLTTGDPFLADLREYMGSGQYENPFEAPHLDLYKWWYCFPTVLGRPAFGDAARKAIDEHHRVHYWRTLNFYPHKALIRYRREPWTGLDYAVSFIWPVAWRDGVRYFVDQNESASVILYCLWAYGQYYGDWATVRSNWNLAQYVHRYLTRFHDWALMASSNQEFFSTVGIDMLNSEAPGNLAYARIARMVGDERAEALGLYLAAKAAVPTVARLYMPDYIRSITAEGDPWREWKWFWSFHENSVGGSDTMVLRGGSDTIAALSIGMLDTSKGTSPEICLLYKRFAAERINAYERDVAAFAREQGVACGWAHLMQRAILGWPRDELIAEARRFHEQKPNWGWQSTKCPGNLAVLCVADTPLFLADWAPAEYVSGRFTPADDTVRLTLENREATCYEVRLYSQRAPAAVRLGDAEHKAWTYDAKAGWLRITLPGQGTAELAIRLGKEAQAPLHPYLSR